MPRCRDNACDRIDEPTREWADRAYRRCAEWFGMPGEHYSAIRVIAGRRAGSRRDPIRNCWIIRVGPDRPAGFDRNYALAWHAFHCATFPKWRLMRGPWMAPALAHLAARHICDQPMWHDHVEDRSAQYRRTVHAAGVYAAVADDLAARKGACRSPRESAIAGACLGEALESVAGWDALRLLAAGPKWNVWNGWEDWLALVPDDGGEHSRYLLELRGAQVATEVRRPLDLARALYLKADFTGALRLCDGLVNGRTATPAAYELLGRIQADSGNLTAAIAAWRRAVGLHAENARVRYMLGRAYLTSGDPDNALPHLIAAVDLDARCALAVVDLGTTHAEAGRTNVAIAHWRRALQMGSALAAERARAQLARIGISET